MMPYSIIATLALLLPGHQTGGEDEKPLVVVQCKPDAEIRGTDIRLSDIAEVRTSDLDLTERLLGVTFGRRPATGFNRVLSRQDILLRLAREGFKSAGIQMAGASKVVLHPVAIRLMPQDVIDAAEPVLRAAIDLESHTDIEFELMSKLRPTMVPPGRFGMDLSAKLKDGTIQHSSANIEIAVLVDEVEFSTIRVTYRLRRFHHVLVAGHAIRKGTPMNEINVTDRRIEAAQGMSPYLTDPIAVAGKVAARDIQAGTKLTLASIMDPAIIFKGDPVNLVSSTGRIRVSTRAVALSDGAIGGRIAVRNLTAGKVVQATVHGRGLVVIEAASSSLR